jgi:TRAP transporter TAXI family solute receptor
MVFLQLGNSMAAKQAQNSGKDLLITFGPALGLIIFGFWLASQFISPAPPKKIIISTGSETGAYYHFAKQYQPHLAKLGIELEILQSSGSGENIDRLLNKQADIAFVQGGTGQQQPLLSLGSLYYEPIWIFINKNQAIEKLSHLKQRKVAIGQQGSGTQIVAKQLLALNHIDNETATLLPLSAQQAVKALLAGEVDAAFIVAAVDSPLIQTLLQDKGVTLLNLERAETYTRLLPFLSTITLLDGIIDLQHNNPEQSIQLLAPAANLVFREDLHSAIIILLLQAASDTHGGNSIFATAGSFPNQQMEAFPVSDVAERFYKVGPPFLMRYLPFWAAIFIDRMIVMLIPLLALLFPLVKVMPPVYRWRVRSKIYRWYKELQDVDNDSFNQQLNTEQSTQLHQQLDRIEAEVNKVKTPLSYADQVYNLLLHIDLVRKKINTAD